MIDPDWIARRILSAVMLAALLVAAFVMLARQGSQP